MAHLLPAVKHLGEGCELIHYNIAARNTNLWQLIRASVEKAVSQKRARVNAVYTLLVVSILFTLLGAVVTCMGISPTEEQLWTQSGVGFNLVRFLVFVLLATTCSLALITIVKKARSNSNLLAKLKTTNRHLEEEVRRRTHELAEAIKAKDHFLGVATHDLKAPLSGILGLLELVRLQNNNRSAEETEYLAHIEYSCKKLQRLIADILEINRIDQGNYRPNRLPVDLLTLLKKLRFDFLPQAEKKNIHLAFIQDTNVIIETDADSLSRILENLLSNAIKFSPQMKMVSLRVSSEYSHVNFEISDQGPGISPAEQPKLFNKFQRLSNRPTNFENSTGLGLSIVKELTTQLGGEISLATEVGKGSTFVVTLPYSETKHVTEEYVTVAKC